MVDVQLEAAAMPTTLNMAAKKKELNSNTMKRTSDLISTQNLSSDFTVTIGGISFSLHKFPLASKCGYIRKLFLDSNNADLSVVEIPDVPGGPEGFELAAKFCYGINFELSTKNIAMVRCVAEFLEMTEDYAIGNLVARTEAYLNEVGLKTLMGAVSILKSSENLLPIAEKVKLVNRCIDAIAFVVTKESQTSFSGSAESGSDGLSSSTSSSHRKAAVDWWAEELVVLRIHTFQRVLLAMISRGFKQCALGPILMLYAQRCLHGLEILGKSKKNIEPKQETEKRIVLETIVSLLPREKNAMSVGFLSMLIRAAIHLETTVACRLDLEKRMGLQLGDAVLDDILIPSFRFDGDTLFDVDTVHRVLMNYLEYELENAHDKHLGSPRSDMERVGKLMESYLAEIASDRNLSVSKFVNLAEHVPEQARATDDGMYRAVDVYLKAHPVLTDTGRKKVCNLINAQKLSPEACAHASRNDRLPVQTAVQILYQEQRRLGDTTDEDSGSLAFSSELGSIPTNQTSSLEKENRDLKFELIQMKTRLKDLERLSAVGSPVNRKSFLGSVSKRLARLNPFHRADWGSAAARSKPSRSRRHSIS